LPDLGQPAFSADKHLGHCRDQAEIIPRLIDATAHRQDRPSAPRHESETELSRAGLWCFIEGVAPE